MGKRKKKENLIGYIAVYDGAEHKDFHYGIITKSETQGICVVSSFDGGLYHLGFWADDGEYIDHERKMFFWMSRGDYRAGVKLKK